MMKKSGSIYYWARDRTFIIINDEIRFVQELFPGQFCAVEKCSLKDQLSSYGLIPLFVLSRGEKKLAVYHPSLCDSSWRRCFSEDDVDDHEDADENSTPNNELANNNRQMPLYEPHVIAMTMTTTAGTPPTNHHQYHNPLVQNCERARVSNDRANDRMDPAGAGAASEFAVLMSEESSSSLLHTEGRNAPMRHIPVFQPLMRKQSNSKAKHGDTAIVIVDSNCSTRGNKEDGGAEHALVTRKHKQPQYGGGRDVGKPPPSSSSHDCASGDGGEDDWMCEHCMREIFKTYEDCVAHEAICPCRELRDQGKCGDND
eukprot:CAMPEP_0196808490 /NCGR_PEP_ID=MMETSP1362-20130617/8472_1 /TAXON_ID=163516 /ORGANISM="Leptocylindrus danicus, Strain CCMP1856" /LENGTH=313 /DNA_ID=CAMNT_0042182853 /DNA_START=160 /DNA_END=1101 /DNA_ORIENTATION=+